ncbi:hypothetical protein MM221_11295 [Salipaludibacillus sp. LMS25]|jgi:hypothetical protein|uniref:hypothetical protein n=1 Tax=Salipaludibacillus sp. LMS25 TaxID=2924031 RepID=UPI0020D18050|nr:hypothetical protein [Salipaludibacillus sp. LMS25]UTR13236.1 hypothetical protein MM221_11295 [Salipaludibacillus sp. LMS25]
MTREVTGVNWKQCGQLMVFEWTNTPYYLYLLNGALAILAGYFGAQVIPEMLQAENKVMGLDVVFIFGLIINAYLYRPKVFTLNEVKNNLHVAPIQLMLRQMAIKPETIMTSRMLANSIMILGWSIIFLISFHRLLPTQTLTEMFPHFLSFSCVWVLLVLVLAGMIPAAEPGDVMKPVEIFFWLIVITLIGGMLVLGVRFMTGSFLFEWVLLGVKTMPLLLPILLLPLLVVANLFWSYYMKRYLRRTNYDV